jgi:DNA-binding transcriptional ArsR family regulator
MKHLNPTLWRTCRVLAGATRIRLLRHLHEHPGQNLTALAAALGISLPYASQEMRRIQSRGLLQATHCGSSLVYRLRPDPQVSTASPLLKAVQTALNHLPPQRDGELTAIASGLAHERRISMTRLLLQSPRSDRQMQTAIPMAPRSYYLHLRALITGGFVVPANNRLVFRTPPHPLGRALVRLLRQGVSR